MKLRPLHDRVVVKRLEQETKTASGIVIPDAAAEKPDQGEVLAVGPGKRNDKGDFVALNVKVGDRVLFGKYSGQTVKVDGDELLVMREEDLFAVVEKFAGIIGPGLFAVINFVTGSSRGAILAIISFFVVGGILLALVDVKEGQALARPTSEA